MTSVENGMLMQHASLGIGTVIAIEPNAGNIAAAGARAKGGTPC